MSQPQDQPDPLAQSADFAADERGETPHPVRTPEEWLKLSIKWAAESNDRVLTSLDAEIQAGGASERVVEARDEALNVREKIKGVGRFAQIVITAAGKATDHPVVTGTTIVALLAGMAIATALLWPAKGGAGATQPTAAVATKGAAEERAVKLMKDGDYAAAEKVLDLEVPAPQRWHLHGELEQLRGDYKAARAWYQQAADAGYELSKLTLAAMDRKKR